MTNENNNSNTPTPIISTHFQSLIDLWKKDLRYGYPVEIQNEYGGSEMSIFFGPKEDRKPIQYFSSHQQEYEKLCKVIRSYSDPGNHIYNGKIILPENTRIPMVDLVRRVFSAFSNIVNPATKNSIFYGIQLNTYNIEESVLGGFLLDYKQIMVNISAQRETDLVRIFTLACNFDSSLVYGAKGRLSRSENKIYCNDGSHGTVALALHGVLTVPVSFSTKEHSSIDYNQFLACNFDVLLVTHYDVWKNQVARMIANLNDGIPVKVDDIPAYNLYLALKDAKVKLVAKGQTPVAGECNVTQQLQRLFATYSGNQYQANNTFITALRLVRHAWPTHPIDFAVVWGLIEFFESQSRRVQSDPTTFTSLSSTLSTQWNKPKDVWKTVYKHIKKQYPVKENGKYTGWKDHRFNNSSNRGIMIAAAIKTLIENRDAWIKEQPGRNIGLNVKFEPIIHEGRLFEMDMPYTTDRVKSYTKFIPTVSEFDIDIDHSVKIDIDYFNAAIDEFESNLDDE